MSIGALSAQALRKKLTGADVVSVAVWTKNPLLVDSFFA
jgi:hypothetical protein